MVSNLAVPARRLLYTGPPMARKPLLAEKKNICQLGGNTCRDGALTEGGVGDIKQILIPNSVDIHICLTVTIFNISN